MNSQQEENAERLEEQRRFNKTLRHYIGCDACETVDPAHRCGRCMCVYYCNVDCQRQHWRQHKKECRPVATFRAQLIGMDQCTVIENEEEINVETECSICLEDKPLNPVLLKCKHAFCFACLQSWQTYNERNNQRISSCPYCRAQIESNLVDDTLKKARLYSVRAEKSNIDPDERKSLYEAALQEVDKILENNQREIRTLILKGNINTKFNPPDAVEAFQSALACDAENESNRIKHEAIIDSIGERMEAGDDEGVERLSLELEAFRDSAGDMHLIGDGPYRLVFPSIMLAEAHEAAEDWVAAKDIYVKQITTMEDPELSVAAHTRMLFSGLSRCCFQLQNYERAIFAATAALEMNRHFPGVHKLLALPHKKLGNKSKAIEFMSRAVLYEAPWDDTVLRDNRALLEELLNEQSDSPTRRVE